MCDMLYSCNFALIGLHEAAAATGDPFYAEAEERLARFSAGSRSAPRPIRSWTGPGIGRSISAAGTTGPAAPTGNGGPGARRPAGAQPWIAGTLALRRQRRRCGTWCSKVDLKTHFDRLRPQMLPDEELAVPNPGTVSHAARDKPVKLTTPPEPAISRPRRSLADRRRKWTLRISRPASGWVSRECGTWKP